MYDRCSSSSIGCGETRGRDSWASSGMLLLYVQVDDFLRVFLDVLSARLDGFAQGSRRGRRRSRRPQSSLASVGAERDPSSSPTAPRRSFPPSPCTAGIRPPCRRVSSPGLLAASPCTHSGGPSLS